MLIACEFCGAQLEAPDGLMDGQHILCDCCGKKFAFHSAEAAVASVKGMLVACPCCGQLSDMDPLKVRQSQAALTAQYRNEALAPRDDWGADAVLSLIKWSL